MDCLDLHGFTWGDAREELVRAYNEAVERQEPLPLEVIHGYGASGKGSVLRSAVRTFLTLNGVHFTPGEDYDGNPGHTLVTPGDPLPEGDARLRRAILAWCASPRTKSEISGKFRRHGQPAIDEAMRSLQTAKRLVAVAGPGPKKWRAA